MIQEIRLNSAPDAQKKNAKRKQCKDQEIECAVKWSAVKLCSGSGLPAKGGGGGESPRFRAAVHRLPLFESVG